MEISAQKKRQYGEIDERRQASAANVENIKVKLEPIDVSAVRDVDIASTISSIRIDSSGIHREGEFENG